MLSLVTFFVVIAYGAYKLKDVVETNEYKVQLRELRDYYSIDEKFGAEDGLMFAAAITAYDGSPDDIEDPSYGRLVFNYKRWGVNSEVADTEIETKSCTAEDLNDSDGSNTKSKFFKLKPGDQETLDTYWPKFKCIKNPDGLQMWGNFDSLEAQNFQLAFVMCNQATSSVPCKSAEEIKRWMSKKYIIMLLNEKQFIKHKFEDQSMQNESRIYWQTLTPRNPTEFVIQIFRTYVDRQDGYIGANFLEREELQGFEFKLGVNREINY